MGSAEDPRGARWHWDGNSVARDNVEQCTLRNDRDVSAEGIFDRVLFYTEFFICVPIQATLMALDAF